MRHKSLVMTVLFTASSVECRTFTFGHFSLQQPSSRGRKRNKNLNFSVTCIIMNMDFNILFFTRTERRRVLVKRCFLIKKTEQLPLLCCLSVCLSTHDFNFLRSSKCAVWWLYYMSIVRQHRVEWNRNTKKNKKKLPDGEETIATLILSTCCSILKFQIIMKGPEMWTLIALEQLRPQRTGVISVTLYYSSVKSAKSAVYQKLFEICEKKIYKKIYLYRTA